MKFENQRKAFVLFTAIMLSFFASAQEKPGSSAQEVADKLSNPVANLISVPLQNNVDYGIGPHKGSKYSSIFNR